MEKQETIGILITNNEIKIFDNGKITVIKSNEPNFIRECQGCIANMHCHLIYNDGCECKRCDNWNKREN